MSPVSVWDVSHAKQKGAFNWPPMWTHISLRYHIFSISRNLLNRRPPIGFAVSSDRFHVESKQSKTPRNVCLSVSSRELHEITWHSALTYVYSLQHRSEKIRPYNVMVTTIHVDVPTYLIKFGIYLLYWITPLKKILLVQQRGIHVEWAESCAHNWWYR